jgi:hypothetical protein
MTEECSVYLFATRHLYFSFTHSQFCRKQERRIFHAQTYIPAEPSPPLKDARLSHPYEDQERTRRDFAAPRQGAQESFR